MVKRAKASATAPSGRGADTAVLDSRDGSGADLEPSELEDRIDREEPEARSTSRRAPAEEADEPVASLPFVGEDADDLRQRIVSRLSRTSRDLPALDENGEEEPVDEEDQSPVTGVIVKKGEMPPADEDQPEDEEIDAPATPAAKNYIDIPDDGVVRLKVRGETVEMSGSDFKANAQKLLAGDQYFAEAKTLIEEARALRRQPDSSSRTAADDQSERTDEPPPPAPKQSRWDKERLAAILDKWQTGDPQEGVDDLAALLDEAASANAVDPTVIANAANEVYQAAALTDAVNDQLSRAVAVVSTAEFTPLRDHPSALIREQIPEMIWKNTLKNVIAGLKSIGVADEDFAKPGLKEADVIRGYVHFSRQPEYARRLIPIPDLTKRVAADIMKDLTSTTKVPPRPQPGNERRERAAPGNPPAENVVRLTETRVDRKRSLPSQPRATSVRTDASRPAKPRASNSEAIARMEQERREGIPIRRA